MNSIVDRLLEALDTTSQQVQNAVSSCLQPLMVAASDRAGELVDWLFDQMVNGKKQSARRGAAAGLGGVMRGYALSLLSLLPTRLSD